MKRSERSILIRSLLIGVVALPAGCSTPDWARQLSQLPTRWGEPATDSSIPESPMVPAAAPAIASPSDVTAASVEVADSSAGQISLSSWGNETDERPAAAAIGDSGADPSQGTQPSQGTLARLVVQADTPPAVEVLPPAVEPSGVDHGSAIAGAPRPPTATPLASDLSEQPISLEAALAITSGQNPQANFARQRIAEAFANLEAAEVLWLPSIRAGANYNKHEGRIQDVAGEIIETSRGSIYTGLGAQTVGAGSPAVPGLLMDFHLRDAIFQPRIASQALGARRQESRAVINDLMLETAVAYIDLLEAMQLRAVAAGMLVEAEWLAEMTLAFAETGQGIQADADRSRAEVSFRQVDLRRSDEMIQLASVRLARLLRADQSATLVPVEPVLIPIDMVSMDLPLPHLISTGLVNRPELAEARYLVGEAVQRYQRERYAPLVPSVLLGLSYGGNAGGLGSNIDRFGDRMDFDVAAFWEVRNLGWGERAARNASSSRLEQARWRQLQQMDQVAADVAAAQAEVNARRDQLPMAQQAIAAAEDSYRRNRQRIRDVQGLPIEVLQSIQALDEARRRYTIIVADYNRSQFRLQRALGWPVESIDPHVPFIDRPNLLYTETSATNEDAEDGKRGR